MERVSSAQTESAFHVEEGGQAESLPLGRKRKRERISGRKNSLGPEEPRLHSQSGQT